MAVNSNLNQIIFQDNLRSSPVRENFTDIQNDVNDLQSQITNLSASTSTSEIIDSRDSHSTLQDRLHSTQTVLGNGVTTTYQTINSCDSTTGFTAGTGATALDNDTTNYVEGSASLKLGKSTTTSTDIEYTIGFSSLDYNNTFIKFSVYVDDSTTLNKLNNVYFDITPDANFSTNYKRFNVTLLTGWNEIILDANNPASTTGTVADDASIQFGRIFIQTNNNSDTFTSGKMLLDDITYYGTELKIIAQDTPDMTVKVSIGEAIVNGNALKKSSTENSGTIVAPSSNPRIDIVTININNDVIIYSGAENASPSAPATPANHIKLADIYLRVGATSIKNTDDSTNGYITDRRDILINANNIVANLRNAVVPTSFVFVGKTPGMLHTTVQSAIDYLVSDHSGYGTIYIQKDTYTETLSYTGVNEIQLFIEPATVLNAITISGLLYITSAGISNSIEVGYKSNASGADATALGSETTASGAQSLALGHGSEATNTDSISIGRDNSCTGSGSISINFNSVFSLDNETRIANALTMANGIRPTDIQTSTTLGSVVTQLLTILSSTSGKNQINCYICDTTANEVYHRAEYVSSNTVKFYYHSWSGGTLTSGTTNVLTGSTNTVPIFSI